MSKSEEKIKVFFFFYRSTTLKLSNSSRLSICYPTEYHVIIGPRYKLHHISPLLSHLLAPGGAQGRTFLNPALFLSFSTVLLHVIFGLPLAFQLSGVHPSAVLQSFSLLSKCPSQFHLLRRTSQLTLLISAI